jgi:hypothetical protein
MRRFDKKKIIQEANLRLENERLFDKISLNEVGDSKGYPYEFVGLDDPMYGYKIRFKVPKDATQKTSAQYGDETHYVIEASFYIKHANNPDIIQFANELGYVGDLPKDAISIYVSFGVLSSGGHSVEFPEFKSTTVFSVMATIQTVVLDLIEKNKKQNRDLLFVYSYPMGGGKGGDLREKLYNLYYDMQIKKNPQMFGHFNRFKNGVYSGIYNRKIIERTEDVGERINPIIKSIFSIMVYGVDSNYNQILDSLSEYYEKEIKPNYVDSKFEADEFRRINMVIRNIRADEAEKMLIRINDEKGIDLTKQNGVYVNFGTKPIKSLDTMSELYR